MIFSCWPCPLLLLLLLQQILHEVIILFGDFRNMPLLVHRFIMFSSLDVIHHLLVVT